MGGRGPWRLTALLGFGALALLFAPGAHAQPPGTPRETRTIPGLTAPGRIIVDRWGLAHIYAADARDAFFLQGYNAARDRLWQIDLWRKRGLGRLSASFGPAFVAQDEAARLFLYRGDMAAEWAAYPANAHAWTQAFVAGINAYVAGVRTGALRAPPEFALTGSAPEEWTADDVVRIRSNALVSNLLEEVARARTLCLAGPAAEPLRRTLSPPHVLKVPEGLDPCEVPDGVLKTFLLATAGVKFDGRRVLAEGPASGGADRAEEGSNNWVVGPGRSVTGRPILANDPHREHALPSLRYLVHLDAPGLHLEGAGEPALPGISFGHNDVAAWGLTIFPADQQDLYVYRLAPGDPGAYLYQGRPEPFRTVAETIEVKGEAPRQIKLSFTRHGPVIALYPVAGRAFAVRSVWSGPGASAYFNAAWLFGAKTFDDVLRARDHWKTPALNLVWADVSGDIGWSAAAAAPVRPNWDGLLPAPGDGRYEWAGLLDPSALPSVRNPAEGVFATANDMDLPKGYPNEARKLSFEWADPSRIDRIRAVLAAKPRLSLADSQGLQTDVVSAFALRARALLQGLKGDTPEAAAALALLTGWDGAEGPDSGPAALFEIWTSGPLRRTAGALLEPAAPGLVGAATAIVDVLQTDHPLLGPDPGAMRRRILNTSLTEAYKEAQRLMGADPALWRWGGLHQARFAEAAGVLAPADRRAAYAVGPVEMGGSSSTPMATSYRGGDFAVAAGASVRIVLDVGAWDNSVMVNTPGQSGDPGAAHYRDLFPLWAQGGYAPLLYSRPAVEAAAERVIELRPAP
jgi:penicillin amidase